MYLRELKQATSVSEAAVISTAQRLGYNPLDGLNSTETLNIINRYIKDHRTELRYPYNAKLFFDHTLSSDVRNARTYDYLTRSLTKYHIGVCMFFASYPPALPPVSGHTVYAIGVKRQVNKPYDLTAMTEMYLANPQAEIGSVDAINVFNQTQFKKWLCMSTIYDERL